MEFVDPLDHNLILPVLMNRKWIGRPRLVNEAHAACPTAEEVPVGGRGALSLPEHGGEQGACTWRWQQPWSCQPCAHHIIYPPAAVVFGLRRDSTLLTGQMICGYTSGIKWQVHTRCSGCAPWLETGLVVLANYLTSASLPRPHVLPEGSPGAGIVLQRLCEPEQGPLV